MGEREGGNLTEIESQLVKGVFRKKKMVGKKKRKRRRRRTNSTNVDLE